MLKGRPSVLPRQKDFRPLTRTFPVWSDALALPAGGEQLWAEDPDLRDFEAVQSPRTTEPAGNGTQDLRITKEDLQRLPANVGADDVELSLMNDRQRQGTLSLGQLLSPVSVIEEASTNEVPNRDSDCAEHGYGPRAAGGSTAAARPSGLFHRWGTNGRRYVFDP